VGLKCLGRSRSRLRGEKLAREAASGFAGGFYGPSASLPQLLDGLEYLAVFELAFRIWSH